MAKKSKPKGVWIIEFSRDKKKWEPSFISGVRFTKKESDRYKPDDGPAPLTTSKVAYWRSRRYIPAPKTKKK